MELTFSTIIKFLIAFMLLIVVLLIIAPRIKDLVAPLLGFNV